MTTLTPTIPLSQRSADRRAELAAQAERDIAIGGKFRVSVPLEFLWAIKERMCNIRSAISGEDLMAAVDSTRKVEQDINALVSEASRENTH